MKLKPVLIPACVGLAVMCLVAWAARIPTSTEVPVGSVKDIQPTVQRLNTLLKMEWRTAKVIPAKPADELLVLRRLSLALHGSVPSLEEIRAFENDTGGDRLDRWVNQMLKDRRFADYFAERLARSFVGVDAGQFVVFRRDLFVNWLSEQLHENQPYDVIVREMIASDGLWTGRPETNFVTAAVMEGEVDANQLASRTVRAFLGQRIDCAQCHDHPFDDWTQAQFQGLAACYGEAELSLVGIQDQRNKSFIVEDRMTLEEKTIEPAVPFHAELLPETGDARNRLARWVTHGRNRRFERAIANRVWGLMFGRAYTDLRYGLAVDDLPDPNDDKTPIAMLDLLGSDFRKNGYSLKRMIRVIAASDLFRLSSAHEAVETSQFEKVEQYWAVFPMTRLRPEQVVGSMLQSSSLQTIDQNSNVLIRAVRILRENDFVKEFGDPGETELDEQAGTIPQALMRMNGRLPHELLEANLFNSSGRIAGYAKEDDVCLENCFLVTLTRRPTVEERDALLPDLQGTQDKVRDQVVEDLYWALFNAWEFSWNH